MESNDEGFEPIPDDDGPPDEVHESDEYPALDAEEQSMPGLIKAGMDFSLRRAEEALERHVKLLDLVRMHAVRATRPNDWVDFSGTGKSMYLDGAGCERLLSRMPIKWSMRITSNVREDYPPGSEIPFSYIVTGDISVTIPGFPPIEITGLQAGRSADAFFVKGAEGRKEPIDPLDVRSAAETAWKRRAISIALGMRNLSAEDLERFAGVDFARKALSVQRRSTDTQVPAGRETDEQMKDASPSHQNVWRILNGITKDRTQWEALLVYASTDRRPKTDVEDKGQKRFPPRRSVLGLTEKAAQFIASKLTSLSAEDVDRALVTRS